MAGDPSMLGLGSFIVGSVALGLALVGVVPAGVLGAPSGLIKTAGYAVLLFAAIGVYLFFSAASAGTGGKPMPLGKPLLRG